MINKLKNCINVYLSGKFLHTTRSRLFQKAEHRHNINTRIYIIICIDGFHEKKNRKKGEMMPYDIRRYQHRRTKGIAKKREMTSCCGKRKETKEKRNQEIK
jgi:hypothetical protein